MTESFLLLIFMASLVALFLVAYVILISLVVLLAWIAGRPIKRAIKQWVLVV